MESNIEKIGGQIVESSNGKIVMERNGRLASGFSVEIELVLDRTQYVPSCSRATFRKDCVCQHSDFNKAVHSSKRSKNTVRKAK